MREKFEWENVRERLSERDCERERLCEREREKVGEVFSFFGLDLMLIVSACGDR